MTQRYRAGLGSSTVHATMDFETYSEAGYRWDAEARKWRELPGANSANRGLSSVGAAVYSEHPSTEVLSLQYDLEDGRGVRFWRPGMPNPHDLFDHVAQGGRIVEAWNAPFERWIWLNVCAVKYGWPVPRLEWFLCAMGKARAFSLPGKLELAGQVLGLPDELVKDPDGKRLLDKFSKPRNPTAKDPSTRHRPDDYPDDAAKLYNYNARDIVAEKAAGLRCPDLEGEELEFWYADFAINARGAHIDRASVDSCIALIGQAHERYNVELRALTGGVVEKASQGARLIEWLRSYGVHLDSVDEEHVEAGLAAIDAQIKQLGGRSEFSVHRERIAGLDRGRRALEIRQAIGSASVKKVYAMANQCTRANRLHDLFSYHGARTGRVTGNGPQPTNLPKEGPPVYRCGYDNKGARLPFGCGHFHRADVALCPWCGSPRLPDTKVHDWCVEAAEDALACINTRSLETVEYIFGEAMAALAGALRALYTAAPGHDLMASDYSAIEAVVLAALAGEEWRLEVFRTHGKIYELSVAKITGIPFDDLMDYKKRTGQHHPLRQTVGKVAELASGYQGWIGAWKAFGADAFMTDAEIKTSILAWRDASPAIVEFWGGQIRDRWRRSERQEFYGVEGAALQATLNPGRDFHVLRLDGSYSGVTFHREQSPAVDGRYPLPGPLFCRLPSGRYLTYHNPRVFPSERNAGQLSLSYEGYNTNPKMGPPGWVTIETWGGRLVENITQATARDILRHAIVNLERAGYPVVLHVYDEIVSEVRQGVGTLEEFERIMATMPAWAQGWPIKAAGGWRGYRYRKG